MECFRNCMRKDSLDLAFRGPNGTLLEQTAPENEDRRSKRKKTEDDLLQTIKNGEFGEIENKVTPRALKCCESSALLMSMKVSFELRSLGDSKGSDEERFNQLASSVERFTGCLLDPLRADKRRREEFGDAMDAILDEAIQFKQKQFFTHPVVSTEMTRKWYGREFLTSGWNRWRPLLNLWCVFDLVFSPILYALFSLIHIQREKKRKTQRSDQNKNRKTTKAKKGVPVTQIYLMYMETPYFKFVRDTLSYIVLLVLHYALCLAPSTMAFSGLEWTILIFFIGRYLVERQQLSDVMDHLKKQRGKSYQSNFRIAFKTLLIYQRDLWNRLDIISLLIYVIILVLRTSAFITSRSVEDNRVLVVSGYLYSVNTLVLTFRVFGHVMEQSKHVGTIQIALFSILKDVRTIFWQFTAAIFAFSIAVTKVYMAEKSFLGNGSDRQDIFCKTSGISCWWAIISQMGWSLLGQAEEFEPMKSVDSHSVFLASVLYAGFLIMGVILLVNMLIALLSNTYQRIQENSLKEWSFKRAVTIQTYDAYDPIPVPFNIIYSVLKVLRLMTPKDRKKGMEIMLDTLVFELDREYFAEHGNYFPLTGEAKEDLLVQETGRNRQMVSQILSSTFQSQVGDVKCSSPEAWQVNTGIRVEGPLLTCKGSREDWPSARYCKQFSKDFPYFEVAILETGKQITVGIGLLVILNESSDTDEEAGCENGFVGYYSDGFIFDDARSDSGKETKGPALALRGDRIRCTVMFGEKQKRGKHQVLFTLNGREIMIQGGDGDASTPSIFVDSDKPIYPYIVMNEGCSVVAKMCSTDGDIADLHREITEVKASLKETNKKLEALLKRLPDLSTQNQEEK